MLFVILLSATGYILAESNVERIVNGTKARPGEIPYIVSLRVDNSHNCGGSILDEYHILTAAHCLVQYQLSQLSIQYGVTKISEDSVNVIKVKKMFPHEKYIPVVAHANDIGVIKLETPIPLSDSVKVIHLPEQNEITPPKELVVVSGWGTGYTGGDAIEDLQTVTLFVLTDEECRKNNCYKALPKYQICATVPNNGQAPCEGDSGGPLTLGNKQVGVVSWGGNPCGQSIPGAFTKVSRYVNWIRDVISRE